MTDLGNWLGGKWLKGAELEGVEHVVRVVATGELVDTIYKKSNGDTKQQLATPIEWKGTVRKLGINKTSAKRIALEYSEKPEKWVGRRLILVPEIRKIAENDVIVIMCNPVKADSLKANLMNFGNKEEEEQKSLNEVKIKKKRGK